MKSHSSLPLRFGLFLVSWLMVWACFRFLLPLFTPFVLAFLTFLLLRPFFRFLRRRVSWPDWCIYTLVLILFFAAMGLVLWFLGSQLIHQCFLLQKKFPGYLESMANRCQYLAVRICDHADRLGGFASGQSFRRLQQFTDQTADRITSGLGHYFLSFLPHLTRSLLVWGAGIFVYFTGVILLCSDYEHIKKSCHDSSFHSIFTIMYSALKTSGLGYLRAEALITVILAALCGLGLFAIGNPYFLILGILLALFDLMPVAGIGMVLTPWCAVALWHHQFWQAAVLFVVLTACLFLREYLEARLIGHCIGLLPIVMAAALYVGVELFGIFGFLLGPVGVVLSMTGYRILLVLLLPQETL